MSHHPFRRPLRGLSATDIGGGIQVIPGFNATKGSYVWQSGDTGTSVARKFNRPMPQTEWRNMRALNPQTQGRPNEAKWGWEVYVGEEVVVPPQWLADIGWTGEVKAPPGTVAPVETIVISGGQVQPPSAGQGTQPAGGGQPATTTGTVVKTASSVGIYVLAALAGLGLAAYLAYGRARPRRALSRRPSSRPALPSRRSSRRSSSRRSGR